MSGLLSCAPSSSTVRLTVSGFLLLLVQNALLLMSPRLTPDCSALISVLTPLALLAFLIALIGIPEPPEQPWRRRHGK